MTLLESNFRTWQALRVGGDAPAPGGDVVMAEASSAEGSEAFKARVISVLEENQLDQARSSKLCQDDFLRLLALFNAAGVHFA